MFVYISDNVHILEGKLVFFSSANAFTKIFVYYVQYIFEVSVYLIRFATIYFSVSRWPDVPRKRSLKKQLVSMDLIIRLSQFSLLLLVSVFNM